MRALIIRSSVLLFATAIGGLLIGNRVNDDGMNAMASPASLNDRTAAADPNPLAANWEGPYGGVPPFDRVQVALFKPALEAAMAENLSQVDRIANDPAAPSFENTLVALEKTGRSLNRVATVYGVWGSTMNSPDFQVVQREMAPRLAAFNDQIIQNEALFKRIETVYNSPAKAQLTPEQQRLTWLY